MFALRRVALRALQTSSPHLATPSCARSITALSVSRATRPVPSVRFPFARRWASEEARAPLQEAEGDEAAPLQEGYSEEAAPARANTRTHRPSSFPDHSQSGRQEVPPSNTIYVGNLFYDVTDADLQREFEKIAPVKSCKVIFDRRGLSKGHGYVEYESVDDAKRAVDTLNQVVLEGRRMMINFKISTPMRREPIRPRSNVPSRTLFIGNMSYEMTDQDLNDLFRDIRNVIDVRVAIDRHTGTPKGFAHADFIDVASAENAMRVLEGKKIYGRQLRIDYSTSSQPVRSTEPQEAAENPEQ